MGDLHDLFGLAREELDDTIFCDCGEPTPGFWGLECSACRRLIPGSVARGIAIRDAR